ncbi:MAG TPA: hypothetical protein VMW55_07735 [Nitrosopumilaceae archaeon]|jgi:hypothetical protein|nr:hypothetical protein [Nitrosopumilaceae archaeon]
MMGLFVFLFAMWLLILVGGGIIVIILGPMSISGYGVFDWIISSGIKAVFAISLVIIWIFILLKIKNWIFRKKILS